MKSIAFALAMTAAASPAFAGANLTQPSAGYTYFHKEGADLAIHDGELHACSAQAAKLDQPDFHGIDGGGFLIGLIAERALIAAMNGVETRRGLMANLENCMVARGWSVVRVADADGRAIVKLGREATRARLAGMVGAPGIEGQIVRAFDNDAAKGDTTMFGKAGPIDRTSLSILALPPVAAGAEPAIPAETAKPLNLPRTARPPFPTAPEAVASLPKGSAVVVVRLGGTTGRSVIFERVGPTLDSPAWTDGLPATFTATASFKVPKGQTSADKTLAFVVPEGRWRIAAMSKGETKTSFCLRSPAFDVASGEVVFAGAFQLDAEDAAPRTDTASAQLALATAPALAGKVRPAAYVNGYEGWCHGTYLYAYEVPGAPSAPAAMQAAGPGAGTPTKP